MESDHEDEKNDKGEHHKHPPLWIECMGMLIASILAYGLPAIRQLARTKTVPLGDNPDSIARTLELPISLQDVIQVMIENTATLRNAKALNDQSFRLYLSSAELLTEKLDCAEQQNVQVIVCDDEGSDKGELVYQITVNPVTRHVILAFRGSVTLMDWLVDADPFLSQMPNPFASETGQAQTMGVHHGFYSDLYGKKRGEELCKYEIIVNHLTRLVEEHIGYTVYVTGHSLGGALATIFSFSAATDDRIPKPVSCITFASPKCGNLDFSRAFQSIQNKGLIRFLRLVNSKDVIPTMPDRWIVKLACDIFYPTLMYQHVGMKLILSHNQSYEFKFPAEERATGICSKVRQDSVSFARRLLIAGRYLGTCCCRCEKSPVHHEDVVVNHGCQTYMKCLSKTQGELQGTFLNHLNMRQKSRRTNASRVG